MDLNNDIEAKFDKQYKEILQNTPLWFEVTDKWREMSLYGLKFNSPVGLGLTGPELRDLKAHVREGKELNCWQFALLANNLEARSQEQLKMSSEEYDEVQVISNEYSEAWSIPANVIRKELLEKLVKEAKITGKSVKGNFN